MSRKFLLLATLICVLLLTMASIPRSAQQVEREYDPWADLNDDGKIDIWDIAYAARMFGATGEPLAAKAAIEYDSGWINITGKAGEYITVTHNLNTTDIMVDIQGKMTADGGPHQRHLGLTAHIPGWNKTYGGIRIDQALSLAQTADGGYVLAGFTYSFGAGRYDFWLVKTDAYGNIEWNKTYGGPDYDRAWSVIQTSDGGYAIAGYTESFGAGLNDFWLVKTDSAGNLEWNKTYGGTSRDVANALVQTSDGGYAIAGYTESFGAGSYDFWLVKTDAYGNAQWNKTYGGTNDDWALSLVQTSDGGYAMAGSTYSFGAGRYDFWLVKTDSAGNLEWNKTYGGTNDDWALSLVQTSDGGYAIAGETWSFGAGDADFWLVRTDAAGNVHWNKTYGGPDFDAASSLVQTSDGGYAIAGFTYSFGAGDADFWLVKADAELGLAWTDSTANTITLYRGATDSYWNYVRVRIWKVKETP